MRPFVCMMEYDCIRCCCDDLQDPGQAMQQAMAEAAASASSMASSTTWRIKPTYSKYPATGQTCLSLNKVLAIMWALGRYLLGGSGEDGRWAGFNILGSIYAIVLAFICAG